MRFVEYTILFVFRDMFKMFSSDSSVIFCYFVFYIIATAL